MGYIIFLVMIISLSLPISNFFKRKIETAIPISVVFIIILIYITGLFDNLNLGVKIVQVIFIISLFYNFIFIIKSVKNKTIIEKMSRIITPGLLIYISLFLVLIILNNQRIFEEFDEFNHWGLIVKNMYLNDAFGTIENSIVTFNEYPPFTAIFQYFFLKISGIYSEDLIIIAQGMLYISMIIFICEHIDFDKNLKKIFLVVPTIIILPLIFYDGFFINILVDGLLGILFGIGLFSIYKENTNYEKCLFLFILISLVLTKTTGMLLVILLIIFKFLKTIRKKENIKWIFIFFIIPMFFITSWNAKIYKTDATKQWHLIQDNNYESLKEFKESVTEKYIDAIFYSEEFTERNLTLIMCLGLLGIYSFFIYKMSKDKKEYKIKLIEMTISLIVFCVGLLLIYINIFEKWEAEALAGFERYISTMLLAWAMFNFFVFFYENDVKMSMISVFLTVLIILIPLKNINEKYIDNKNYIKNSIIRRNFYTSITDYKNILTIEDRVLFVVDSSSDLFTILKVNRYETMGTNINIVNSNLDFLDDKNAFCEVLETVDYVYIYSLRDDSIFENEISNKTLYKVDKNNILKLEKVYDY